MLICSYQLVDYIDVLFYVYLIDKRLINQRDSCRLVFLSVEFIKLQHISDLTRQQYYSHTNVKDIFNLSSNKNVIDFIKNINLYDKL